MRLFQKLFILLLIFPCFIINTFIHAQNQRPNILFAIADDWSYPHAGVYGDKVVKTPNFDRIAKEGILFDHSYVSSPSCTPSRAAVVTGQQFWRLGIGANLYGPLPPEHPIFPDLLEASGYFVGHTRKGWGPGTHEGRKRNPAGDRYEDFEAFLAKRPDKAPFYFWFGSFDPHRGYKKGSGVDAGITAEHIDLPACFPESEEVRSDVADYYKEVQDYDSQIGALLAKLEELGELDNTLIVVTSDNGMPFPRCKGNLYDMGTRMPLAIRWGDKIKQAQRLQDFVSHTDFAPTFLEAAELPIPREMTGKSLIPLFEQETTERDHIFFGKERHLPTQESGDWGGFPMRAIRTHDFLYVKNFKPENWPAGTPNYQKATLYPSYLADVDGGPTRSYMIDHRMDDELQHWLYELSFGKRPAEELYDNRKDPNQLYNLTKDPAYAAIKANLEQKLMEELIRTEDPRAVGGEMVFESYPYTGGSIYPDHFKRSGRNYATVRLDNFPSKYLDNRTVEVLVPVKVGHNQRFPVLYMFDGQNIFHEFEGWGGKPNKGWQVDDTLDSLFKAGSIPQMIVVGIYNEGEKRMAEYMPDKPYDLVKERISTNKNDWYTSFEKMPPEAGNTLKFLVQELKPFIDNQYKTLTDRTNTFISGSSMGGLISAYAICEYPEVFGGAACFSTHWPPLDGVFLEYFTQNLPDPDSHRLYFDYGTEGLDGEYEPFQKIADRALEAKGYTSGKNWLTKKYKGAKHHEDDWRRRFHIPIEFFLSNE